MRPSLDEAVQTMTPSRLLWWVEVESNEPDFEPEHCIKCLFAKYLRAVVGEQTYVTDRARLALDEDENSVELPFWATELIYEFDHEYEGTVPRQEAVQFLQTWQLP